MYLAFASQVTDYKCICVCTDNLLKNISLSSFWKEGKIFMFKFDIEFLLQLETTGTDVYFQIYTRKKAS